MHIELGTKVLQQKGDIHNGGGVIRDVYGLRDTCEKVVVDVNAICNQR